MLHNCVSILAPITRANRKKRSGKEEVELRTNKNIASCLQFILTAKSKVMQYYPPALLKISKVKGYYHFKNKNGCMKQPYLLWRMMTFYPGQPHPPAITEMHKIWRITADLAHLHTEINSPHSLSIRDRKQNSNWLSQTPRREHSYGENVHHALIPTR